MSNAACGASFVEHDREKSGTFFELTIPRGEILSENFDRRARQKKRADRLPLSDPPITFFVTQSPPLSGRNCTNIYIDAESREMFQKFPGFWDEPLPLT